MISSAVSARLLSAHIKHYFSIAALTFVSKMSTARLKPEDVIAEPTSLIEKAKRQAARQAVDDYVKSGMCIGVGSGSTIVYAIQRLAERLRDDSLDVKCVPTSFQSRQLITDTGLFLADLNQCPSLDVAIDGADEVDRNLNCIKGGGACQTQEKIVASAAKTFVLVADNRKQSDVLGSKWKKGIPIEVIPSAYALVSEKLRGLGGKPQLRMAVAKAGPVVTDNGNFVLDADFGEIAAKDVPELNVKISMIPGVVETGLFVGMAAKAYFGMEDGTVEAWLPTVATA